MSSGELRHFIEIQSQSDGVAVAGDFSSPVWAKHCDAWANIQYMAGKNVGNDRDSTLGQAKIKIRYQSDITNSMRVVYEGRYFDIEDNFDVNGRRQYLIMLVKISDKS